MNVSLMFFFKLFDPRKSLGINMGFCGQSQFKKITLKRFLKVSLKLNYGEVLIYPLKINVFEKH